MNWPSRRAFMAGILASVSTAVLADPGNRRPGRSPGLARDTGLPDFFTRPPVKAPPPITGTSYYVKASGNDSLAGTSINAAWKTIAKAAAMLPSLPAGSAVLFEGGSTFVGQMDLSTLLGTPADRITIGSYGAGRATLNSTKFHGVLSFKNVSNLVVRNLNLIGTPDPAFRAGSVGACGFFYTCTGAANVNIDLIDVHCDNANNGFVFAAYSGVAHPLLTGIAISGCSASGNMQDGLWAFGNGPGLTGVRNFANVLIENCVFSGNGFNGCRFSAARNGVFQWCSTYNNGALTADGPIGMLWHDSTDVVIRLCESHGNTVSGGAAANRSDGAGFDMDGGVRNGLVEYCYSHDNVGAGILVWAYPGSKIDDITIRNNFCQNNGGRADNHYGDITLGSIANADVPTNIKIYNNTLAGNPKANSRTLVLTGDYAGMTGVIANNIIATPGANSRGVSSRIAVAGISFMTNAYTSAIENHWGAAVYTTQAAWRAAKESTAIVLPYSPPGGTISPVDGGYDAKALATRYRPDNNATLNTGGSDLATLFSYVAPSYNGFGEAFSWAAIGAGRGRDQSAA